MRKIIDVGRVLAITIVVVVAFVINVIIVKLDKNTN